MFATFLLNGAVSHQVLPALDDESQNLWSTSLRHAVKRAPRIFGYSFARTLIFLLPMAVIGILTATVSPAFVLVAVLLLPVYAVLWVRLSLVGVSASVGPEGTMFLFILIGQPFVAAVSGVTVTSEPDPNVVNFGDLLGPSPSLLALSSFFSALGSGLRDVILATGGTKLYQRLEGPIGDVLVETAEPEQT